MSRDWKPGGYYLRPALTTFAPHGIVSIIVETEAVSPATNGMGERQRPCAFHVAIATRPSHAWSSSKYMRFRTGHAMHEWLEGWGTKDHRTYIYTPSPLQCLNQSKWWTRLEERGVTYTALDRESGSAESKGKGKQNGPGSSEADISRLAESDPGHYYLNSMVPGGQCEIVRYRTHDRSFQWAGHRQHLDRPEDEIAEAIGYRWTREASYRKGMVQPVRHPVDRCLMWCEFYKQLSKWWVAVNGGPWGATTAALGYSFLRRRLAPRSILVHRREPVGKVENRAIFGGRRQVWYLGNVGTEAAWSTIRAERPARSALATIDDSMVHLDVRSMYPYLLATLPFPVKPLTHHRRITPKTLLSAMDDWGAIADVCIETMDPEFPRRSGEGIHYPIGRFWTTLCGPELHRALLLGQVQEVREAVTYIMGNPFTAGCTRLLELRQQYRGPTTKAWELFVKLLSVSLSGKIAQTPFEWRAQPKTVPPYSWGPWRRAYPKEKRWAQYRVIAGIPFLRIPRKESSRTMGAAYAYLTAYGRSMMYEYRQQLAPKTVLAQDTDGLWCLSAARSIVSPLLDKRTAPAGSLLVTREAVAGRFFSAQHYWYGSGWVLSGQANPTTIAGTSAVETDVPIESFLNSFQPPTTETMHARRRVDLCTIKIPGRIMADGWVQPPCIRAG